MRLVAGAASRSTLSGTELSCGTEAQHEGTTKLLSCSVSHAVLGEQFGTELVSRKRNTFSYVEREWHNWALWCDLNSQINIWTVTRPSPGINPLPFNFRKECYSQGRHLKSLLPPSKAFVGPDLPHYVTLMLAAENKAGEEELTLSRGLSCLFSKKLRRRWPPSDFNFCSPSSNFSPYLLFMFLVF